jgi:outer membrane beta-barrel protein
VLSTTAFAQGPKKSATAPSAKKDGKVDISDLENKYWAPKDTDFSVVQNRTYTKEGRFFLTLDYGRPINDQWSTGSVYGGTLNYFWSERLGLQATYLKADLTNNDANDFLATNYGSGVRPDFNRLNSYYGLGFNIVPFYAKMSFWGKKIIYFDMAITPTVGMTKYDQVIQTGNQSKTAFTYGVDISQFFFFTNYFAIRADLKSHWSSQDVVRYHGNGSSTFTGEKVKTTTNLDSLFLIGLTFFY